MFGYVNIYKDELKIKDYNTYRAYYCGLCKMLGKKHNQLVRLALNYDLTFLAVITDSLSNEPCDISRQGCLRKLGKRQTVKNAHGLEFAADMNVLLAYYKLKDDIRDSHSLKALVSVFPFWVRYLGIRKRHKKICDVTSTSLMRLSFLEDTECDIIDKAANEFAVILEAMFKEVNPVLEKFGYMLGRIIYIMDALDDMDEDYKKSRYNPAVLQYGYKGEFTEEIKSKMTDILYFSLGELSTEYENLDIKKNKAIIDNIIYLGLRAKCDIINERNNKK